MYTILLHWNNMTRGFLRNFLVSRDNVFSESNLSDEPSENQVIKKEDFIQNLIRFFLHSQSCEMSQIWQIYLCKNIGRLG